MVKRADLIVAIPRAKLVALCVSTQELQERYRLSSAPKIGKVHLCVGTQELQERYRLSSAPKIGKRCPVGAEKVSRINADIRWALKQRYRLFKKAKRSNKDEDWRAYRTYRNLVTAKIRDRKLEYLNEFDLKASDPNSSVLRNGGNW